MKNILAIDTASKLLGVTLQVGNSIYQREINEGFTHSENLVPLIKTMVDSAEIKIKDLDLLVCSRGPGSFTGLRIGMATMKGMAVGLGIPLISIPTLDLYAYENRDFNGLVLPIIDARKKCFYTAKFVNGQKLTEDLDLTFEEILELIKEDDNILLTGIDAEVVKDKILTYDNIKIDEHSNRNYSKSLIALGIEEYGKNGADSESQGPIYKRKSEAEIMLEKKRSE